LFTTIQSDTPGLYQFLTKELSLPCIAYNTSLIRVFNAIPSDIKLDVYLDGDLIAKELEYKKFSYYIPILEAEVHNIKVFISSKTDTPIIDTQVQLYQANVETLALIGSIESPDILSILGEPIQQPYPNNSVIRYANLSNNNLVVNVLLNDSIISSTPLNINEYNRYSLLDPILYNFQFELNDNKESNIQTSVSHILKPTRIYTFYLVGCLDPTSPIHSNYPLELVISVDISSLIKQCPLDMKRLL